MKSKAKLIVEKEQGFKKRKCCTFSHRTSLLHQPPPSAEPGAGCRDCVNLLKTSQRKSEKEMLSLATVHLPEMISSNLQLTKTTFQARSEYASQI